MIIKVIIYKKQDAEFADMLLNTATLLRSTTWQFSELTPVANTGCPKKRTFRMLLEPQVAGAPCVWKLIFWSFLTKTKPDQAFPSNFKI